MNKGDEGILEPETETEPGTAAADAFAHTPWTVDVDVWLVPKDGADFYLETCLPRKRNGDIIFENNRRPGFNIRFNLRDPRNTGYLFPSDPQLALSCSKGAGCPPSGSKWGQFAPTGVANGNATLVVRNLNKHADKGEFGYTLHLTKAGAPPWDLDPGGDNANGQES